MSSEEIAVFFYGLFMDESLLTSKGIRASQATVGHVDGYGLRIGRRATLVPEHAGRTYGVVMILQAADVHALYSDESVADYVAESVLVVLPEGVVQPAVCYNLPEGEPGEADVSYAASLLSLAIKLGLPEDHLRRIRGQMT